MQGCGVLFICIDMLLVSIYRTRRHTYTINLYETDDECTFAEKNNRSTEKLIARVVTVDRVVLSFLPPFTFQSLEIYLSILMLVDPLIVITRKRQILVQNCIY